MKYKYLVCCLSALMTTSAAAVDLQLRVLDADGLGFNSDEPYSIEGYPFETLGQARIYALEKVERALEYGIKGDSHILWDVRFNDNPGYLAVTLGPIMSAYYEGSYESQDFFEVGRQYPNTLVSNRIGFWQGYVDASGYTEGDAITDFGGADDYYSYVEDGGDRHRFMATALHEAIHVLGFTSGDCLGNCVPERVSHVDHTSKFKFFWDGAELVQYETLSLDEKEVVHRSQDDFLFIGTQATQDVASNELVDGFSHGGLELHAEVESDGRVDPQNGAHFSPQMEPAQLMHSAGANVLDLGMAAYYLCDVGWCRDGGQVIDVGVATAVSEGVVENETFTVDYVLSGDQNIAIPSATFEFSVDDGLVVQSVLDPDGICQQSGNTFQCERFSFDIGEQYEVSLTLSGPVGDYKIEGGVKSNAYDVDRRPFSNVVDTFITVAEEVVAPPPPPQAEPPMVTPEAPSSSGGSMGVGILALLSMVFVRRFTK